MIVLLKNGNVDVLIENGVIGAVGKDIAETADKVIDCTGLTIMPGICDMHVHFRDPGQTHKENLLTGSDAAAAGGVTAVMCMPNTSPAIDTPESVRDIIERAKAAKIKIYPCAAITKRLEGKELTDFHALKKAGAVAVSDDGMPVANARLMADAMVKAHEVGLPIIAHCEDLSLVEGGYLRISETAVTLREVCLANELKVPIHIAHVSTKEALDFITHDCQGLVTCEVAPHHFTLTSRELEKRDADYKMNPPLREKSDVDVIINSLCSGGIDCVASDHAPHSPSEKADFDNAPNGVIGLETLLAVTLTQLYHTGKLPLDNIVELLCTNPRKILGLPEVKLEAGSPADITIVDLNEKWVVDPNKLHSKSKNTCFKGMTLKGRVKYTLVDGEIVYEDCVK